MATKRLGYLQQHILVILRDISTGKGLSDVSYYGGSITGGSRCISIGRECTLYYDVPWWIIDVRHAGALFAKEHVARLGCNTLRTLNRALHSLIRKGLVWPIPTEIIAKWHYKNPEAMVCATKKGLRQGTYIRFVVMDIPNALRTN